MGGLDGGGHLPRVESPIETLAVDEEGWRARDAAQVGGLDVLGDPCGMYTPFQIIGEPEGIEADLLGVPHKIGELQPVLPGKKQVVHGPESALSCGGLGSLGSKLGVWVNVGERQVPPDESHVGVGEYPAHSGLGLSTVGTLEVAVLDNRHHRGCRASNVIAVAVSRRCEIDYAFSLAI